MQVQPHDRPLPAGSWRRGDSPEFERLANFNDAVYAIAMTLLVLEVKIAPILRDSDSPSVMWSRLGDLLPELVAFGVAFILLGRYWMAHHAFFASLRAYDRRLMGLNLVYLAFVAVLPFPSALIGEYEGNPVSVIVFAVTLAAVSGMEAVMLVHAHRADLLRVPLDGPAFRWLLLASLQPVAVFTITIPLAFVSTTLTLIGWAVLTPALGALLDRSRPRTVDDVGLPMVGDQGRLRRHRPRTGPDDAPTTHGGPSGEG